MVTIVHLFGKLLTLKTKVVVGGGYVKCQKHSHIINVVDGEPTVK